MFVVRRVICTATCHVYIYTGIYKEKITQKYYKKEKNEMKCKNKKLENTKKNLKSKNPINNRKVLKSLSIGRGQRGRTKNRTQ